MKFILVVALAMLAFSSFAIAGTLKEESTLVEGEQREYLVYLPDGYNEDYSYPVLFMFHGMGSNHEQAASSYYQITDLADENEFIAVFPNSLDGLPPKDITYQFFGTTFKVFPNYETMFFGGQNLKRWDIAHVQASNRYESQDTKFVQKMLSELDSEYNVLDSHVFSTGHSYGAMFSFYAGMSLDEIKAFGVHSGGIIKFLKEQEMIDAFIATVQPSWLQGIYSNVIKGWQSNSDEEMAWTIFPLLPRDDVTVPGLVIASPDDPIIKYKWATELYNDLDKYNHPAELVTLNAKGHNWDKAYNQYQWNYFVKNSPGIVSFDVAESTVTEGDGVVNVLVKLNGPRDNDFDVDVNVLASDDYLLLTPSLTFEPGETEKNVLVELISDDLVEADEEIVLSLSSNGIIGNIEEHTITIIDDTVVNSVVEFVTSSSSSEESLGVDVVISLTPAPTDFVSVNLAATGTASAEDFNLVANPILIGPGESEKVVTINVVDDSEVEEDETIVLELTINSGNAELGDTTSYTHTIVNNDEEAIENAKWDPRILTTMGTHVSILWEDNEINGDFTLQFDHATDSPPLIEKLFSYPGFNVKAVEATHVAPNYFWWVLWEHNNGNEGIWREDSYLHKDLERYVSFGFNPNKEAVDFVLLLGEPLVLWQYDDGTVELVQFDIEGAKVANYQYDGDGWTAKYVIVDLFSNVRVLLEKDGEIKIWTIDTEMNLVNEDVFSVPSGYVISDMELGWDGGEHLTRLLWLKDGDAKIWKVNSGIVNEFDFSLDGWRAAEIETTYDDKIRLMFVNEGLAQVWRINQFSGLKENFKEYSLE